MIAKTLDEWIHMTMETEHVPTDAMGWIKRAWEASEMRFPAKSDYMRIIERVLKRKLDDVFSEDVISDIAICLERTLLNAAPPTLQEVCHECHGDGWHEKSYNNEIQHVLCFRCEGTGKTPKPKEVCSDNICNYCKHQNLSNTCCNKMCHMMKCFKGRKLLTIN